MKKININSNVLLSVGAIAIAVAQTVLSNKQQDKKIEEVVEKFLNKKES